MITNTAPFASRKFILAMTVLVIATLLLVFSVIPVMIWRDIVFALLTGYLTSNVVQKAVAGKSTTS
ncbi:hypothetical protein [Rhodoferax sp. BLA1]|uniref:hypothetical protein n=1 Tax=Rhodoferax sp. BLA1 TaxID=2576062 RepID=UPI0015D1D2AE|nr:hypothetical protein [Rhodoferax sp. BLA1]